MTRIDSGLLLGGVVFLVLAVVCGGFVVADDYTIIAFGDSTTATREPFISDVYADLLRANLPARGITGSVLNKGVGGDSTDEAVARFTTDVTNNNPDLVVMQFGINDGLGPNFTTVGQFTANMTSMIQSLDAGGVKVILMTANRLTFQDELLVPYVVATRDIATAESVPLVDVYQMFTDYAAAAPSNSVDDLLLDGQHPNQLGHNMIADALEDEIVAQLIPEPGSLPLLGLGAVLLVTLGGGWCGLRRRHQSVGF